MSTRDLRCGDCAQDVSSSEEYWYIVRDELWDSVAGSSKDKCLCVGCLEARLGRGLVSSDFPPQIGCNWDGWRRSERLKRRMGL